MSPFTAAGAKELRVIERIERFQPELQRLGFGDPEVLEQREIEIQHPGTVEGTARGGAGRAQSIRAE